MTDRQPVPGTRGLDHVGINVPDLDQAVRFFTTAFGATTLFRLPPISDPSGDTMRRLDAPADAEFELAMLHLGGGRLELLQWRGPGQSRSQPQSLDVGASHVAIEVADVPDAVRHLRRLDGVRIIGEPVTFDEGPTPGLTNAFAITPWGMLLELVDWGA